MDYNKIMDEIARLNFEDFLWVVAAISSLTNIYGDYNDKEYLKTNDNYYKYLSNDIFKMTLTISILLYLYFFVRNYNAYKNSPLEQRKLYEIKLLGTLFLIVGTMMLLYFQYNESSFIGSPA